MSDNSKISWTDDTWSVVAGCDKISPGCAHCWAINDAYRMGHNPHPAIRAAYEGTATKTAGGNLNWTGLVRPLPQRLAWPLKRKEPRRIFVANQSDLFHDDVPEEFIAAVFGMMGLCGHHTFQVLTKRVERMADVLPRLNIDVCLDALLKLAPPFAMPPHAQRRRVAKMMKAQGRDPDADEFPLQQVWLGVSVEDRAHGLPRIDVLRQIPAAVRFLSIEPQLEDLGQINLDGIHWVIQGAEAGKNRRPFNLDWARSVRDQCVADGVAYHLKQTLDDRGRKIHLPMLDGKQWAEFPEARS